MVFANKQCQDGFTIFVPKDNAAIAVSESELIPEALSYKIIAYNHHSMKGIVTCSEIIEEVNDDALKKWFVGLQGDILPIDDEVQENVKKVVTSNPQLVDFKQVKSSGDAFLIATAMKYDLTVITEENKTGQKKIPFVCNSLGVPCVDILGLCEKEGWSF